MIYFSKSTNGFFFDGINSDMPADIVEICTDLYNELIAGQQEGGKLIMSHVRKISECSYLLMPIMSQLTGEWN